MSNGKSILAAAAVAALGLIGSVSAADAKKVVFCCKGGPHVHFSHHRHFLVGPTVYVRSSYSGCGWLWNRYLETGLKSYKWRYYACIGD